jgi:hypothetical protein
MRARRSQASLQLRSEAGPAFTIAGRFDIPDGSSKSSRSPRSARSDSASALRERPSAGLHLADQRGEGAVSRDDKNLACGVMEPKAGLP